MEYAKNIEEASQLHIEYIGGKARPLSRLSNAGFNVPAGFVITSNALKDFLAHNGIDIKIDDEHIDFSNQDNVAQYSKNIARMIHDGEMPSTIASEINASLEDLSNTVFAVRSSANVEDGSGHSWAGQFNSFLGASRKTIIESVKECWVSLYSPSALLYRLNKSLHGAKHTMAVVVQELVRAQKAGVAFSANPITHDEDQVLIEACFGFGEGVVSGVITPDTYIVNKQQLEVASTHIGFQKKIMELSESECIKGHFTDACTWRELSEEEGGQQILTEEEITTIAQTTKDIEAFFNERVDVEWVLSEEGLSIVQSRPITTV